jgi:hypothetical protein
VRAAESQSQSRQTAWLFVGGFQCLVGVYALYAGATRPSRLDVFAGVVTLAAGIWNLVLRRLMRRKSAARS